MNRAERRERLYEWLWKLFQSWANWAFEKRAKIIFDEIRRRHKQGKSP